MSTSFDFLKTSLLGCSLLLLAMAVDAQEPPVRDSQGDMIKLDATSYTRGLDRPFVPNRPIIRLNEYYMDVDEVTNEQYQKCVSRGKCAPLANNGLPHQPVRDVSWFEASTYCKFMGKRLPTEAEWEHAAFPDKPGDNGFGPMILERWNFCDVLVIGGEDSEGEPCPEKHDQPELITVKNPERYDEAYDYSVQNHGTLYDMFGNVSEWVADWWDGERFFLSHNFAEATQRDNPTGPPDGDERVIRGGSYSLQGGLKMSSRRKAKPDARLADVGFRCASSTLPQPALPQNREQPAIAIEIKPVPTKQTASASFMHKGWKVLLSAMVVIVVMIAFALGRMQGRRRPK